MSDETIKKTSRARHAGPPKTPSTRGPQAEGAQAPQNARKKASRVSYDPNLNYLTLPCPERFFSFEFMAHCGYQIHRQVVEGLSPKRLAALQKRLEARRFAEFKRRLKGAWAMPPPYRPEGPLPSEAEVIERYYRNYPQSVTGEWRREPEVGDILTNEDYERCWKKRVKQPKKKPPEHTKKTQDPRVCFNVCRDEW